jgi:RluA family pseudouridine synthase
VHIVPKLKGKCRLVDYAIGIFPQIETKNSVKKAIKRAELLLNNEPATTGRWVLQGDRISLVDVGHQNPKKYDIEIEIVYEDDHLGIVSKPPGLIVSGNQFRTLENALVGSFKESGKKDVMNWARPVHRIDSATSGLVLFAKTFSAQIQLGRLFENREIVKTYYAIVKGEIKEDILLNEPINGQKAISELIVLKKVRSINNDYMTLVKLTPRTGRTHQLRIHCSESGHPIVGDTLYGETGKTLLHKGLFLAAVGLKFNHPSTNREVAISIEAPYKFSKLLEREEQRWIKYNS